MKIYLLLQQFPMNSLFIYFDMIEICKISSQTFPTQTHIIIPLEAHQFHMKQSTRTKRHYRTDQHIRSMETSRSHRSSCANINTRSTWHPNRIVDGNPRWNWQDRYSINVCRSSLCTRTCVQRGLTSERSFRPLRQNKWSPIKQLGCCCRRSDQD